MFYTFIELLSRNIKKKLYDEIKYNPIILCE